MLLVLADVDAAPDAVTGAPGAPDEPDARGAPAGGDTVVGRAVAAGDAEGRAAEPLGERSSTGARPGEVEQAANNAARAITMTEGRTQWR